jgi:hypothetical protein
MRELLCPSKLTPAARSLRPKVWRRSCTRTFRNPIGHSRSSTSLYRAAARRRARMSDADCEPLRSPPARCRSTPALSALRSWSPNQRPSPRVRRNDLQNVRDSIERRCVLGKLETRVQIIATLSHRKEPSLIAIFGKSGGRIRGNTPPFAPLLGIDHRNGFAQPLP